MDPGTALAIAGIVLEAVKGLQSYYEAWMDCPKDIMDLRQALAWYVEVFGSITQSLHVSSSDQDASIILRSINECKDACIELQAKLNKIKREGTPADVLDSLKAYGREACYPFKKKSVMKLATLLKEGVSRLHLAIDLLSLRSGLTSLQALKTGTRQLDSIDEKVTDISLRHAIQADELKRQAIFAWLSPVSPSNFHDALQSSQTQGTCSWFIDSQAFTEWKADPASNLWINGRVGSGKSVLCSAVIEAARALPGPLVFFYFSFKDSLMQTYPSLLKSILHQICPPRHVLPQLKDLFETCTGTFPPPEATTSELEVAVLDILRDFSNCQEALPSTGAPAAISLFLDALDEVPFGTDRIQVLDFLGKITSSPKFSLRFMATSRPEFDVQMILCQRCKWKSCSLERRQIEGDIKLYIRNAIKSNRRLERMSRQMQDFEEMTSNTLVVMGDGM